MLIDEVIEKLTEIRKEHGNLDVRYLDCEWGDVEITHVHAVIPPIQGLIFGGGTQTQPIVSYVEIS